MRKVWIYKRNKVKGWWVGWYEGGIRKSKAFPTKALAEHYRHIKNSQLNSDVWINGARTNYKGSADDLKAGQWLSFSVDVTGINAITSITIGVEGGEGLILVDEIFLFAQASELIIPVAPDTANLAGYWSFDENSGTVAGDAVSGNDAALVDVNWVEGQIGSATEFNGSSSLATIDAAVWDGITQQATLAFWANIDATVDTVVFGTYSDANEGNSRVYTSHLPYSNGNVYFDAGPDIDFNTNPKYGRISKAASADEYLGSWNHWAFVKNADTGMMKIYRNGALWHSGVDKNLALQTVAYFVLGADQAGENFWDGSMDELRLYNRELSNAEIQGLAGKTGSFYPALD
ncbi:LamG domain-containing protein [Planctomycetota bacterium]